MCVTSFVCARVRGPCMLQGLACASAKRQLPVAKGFADCLDILRISNDRLVSLQCFPTVF